jgi:hypothetical protein
VKSFGFDFQETAVRGITAAVEGVHGHDVLSLSVVKKWRKRFAKGKITLESDPQLEKPPRSDRCESRQALIEETLFISYKRMYQKL